MNCTGDDEELNKFENVLIKSGVDWDRISKMLDILKETIKNTQI
jgi:hypothetical protein